MSEMRPLDVREVADLLRVHINTVKRIPFAELPYWRMGTRGDRRYDPESVERYIAKRWHREEAVS